ncbi:uncharacterized protein UHOD_12026 [Ustilago sp. UG-2017b]|nr:uncharacterized protein UHOD_12026 [Ustilago sp. UG-2017b]
MSLAERHSLSGSPGGARGASAVLPSLVLFKEIFALCLKQHINLQVTCVCSKANTLTDALSHCRFALIQQEHPQAFSLLWFNSEKASPNLPAASLPPPSCPNKRLSSSGMASHPQLVHAPPVSAQIFATFVSTTFRSPQPFPATFTWETASSPPLLTVGSVAFAEDGSYATVFLPSSKMDPFGTGVTLTAPAVPLMTCAVKALKAICRNCSAPKPLFALEDSMPFDCNSFITTVHRCLQRAATSASALYANADQPLDLSQPAWCNF